MRDVVAVLMAGGVGSRLNILVRHRAKPAVPFGGMYRIIDFTLSNVANCGLPRVAILTQYKPLSLMDHVGDGSAWDLSGRTRAIKILPPKTGEKDWDWYKGTADAVRQNLDFVTAGDYKEVLILSGDHIYCMDYTPLVRFHRDRKADVTVGMLYVPWEETQHFGVGIVDEGDRVIDWQEKPQEARSNLASMGIYVFNREYLVRTLQETKEGDFGQHVIPRALKAARVYGYPFHGYWRDAGTIHAYWDANMDLLDPGSALTPCLYKIKTNHVTEHMYYDRPPTRIVNRAEVMNSLLSSNCTIMGRVQNSVLSPGVVVEKGAFVKDSVVMHDSIIRSGAHVERCVIDKEVTIGRKAIVGLGSPSIANIAYPSHVYSGLTLVGKQAIIPDNTRVGTNCIISSEAREQDFHKGSLGDGQTIEK
jgi:glucose-1-phosphate adenylyltransferase